MIWESQIDSAQRDHALGDFITALSAAGGHIKTVSIAVPGGRDFSNIRKTIADKLSPIEKLREETISMSSGLAINLDYFRLELLDPDAVEMGGKFPDLLSLLWLMAGAVGNVPRAKGSEDYIVFKECGFAVLLRERAFRKFNSLLQEADNITWIFLITDARDAFIEMSEQLPSRIPIRQRVHLYRSYLDNFRINVSEANV